MNRALAAALAAAAVAATSITCSGSADKSRDDRPDAGLSCRGEADCARGWCSEGRCQVCPHDPCPAGRVCSAEGRCLSCGAGCPGDAGPDGGDAGLAPGMCRTRDDCPVDRVCVLGRCEPPVAACRNRDECLRGQTCDQGRCVAGECAVAADCVGNPKGPRCDPSSRECGTCLISGDCKSGELCFGTQCLPAPACADRTACGDFPCLAGRCAPCVTAADCGAGFGCDGWTGRCFGEPCVDDGECQRLSPGHFCNAAGTCEWGCLPPPGCGINCCVTYPCDPLSRRCGGSGADAGTGPDGGLPAPDGGLPPWDGGLPFPDGGLVLVPCQAGCTCPGAQLCLDLSGTGVCPNALAFCF